MGKGLDYEPWKTMNQVCEHIGCNRDTLLTWVREKGCPGVQIGRTWRFKISEVDAWMETYKRQSVSQSQTISML